VTTRTTPAGYTLQAYRTTYYTDGLPTEVDEYDYGNAAQGGLLRKTTTAYATYLTNNIVDMPATVSVYTGGGTLVAQTTYTYDENNTLTTTTGTPQHGSVTGSRGNATTVTFLTAGTTYLTQHSTYYDTGNVNVFTDANGGQTTYAYGSGTSCGNSFVTGVTEAVTSLTRSYAWNCTGGVMTSTADENGQIWQTGYASPADPNYWRPTSTTDPASATTTLCYWPDGPSGCATHTGLFGSESTLNFNGTTSTVDTLTSVDGLGRTHVTQQRQTQGGTNYDSVETDYDAEGRPYQVTVPYTAAAGVTNAGATRTTTAHDSLGRPTLVTDGGGGTTTYTYLQTPGSSPVGFDVLVAVSGTSSQTFTRQLEYDGLGRLTSVCEVTSATGSASCGQSVAATGYLTKYTYDVLNDLLTVTQNAKGTTTQTRTYAYDGLGRMTSEKNPETNQTAYTYTFDTDGTCGTSDGDMVKRIDPQGTVTCYAYDALHRLTSATYPSGGYYLVTPPKYYTYDSATVDGASMSYAKGRLAEAYTGSSKTTDLGFSYSKRGEVSDVYQYSPHSGTNYYYHAAATYWAPQGLPATLNPNMSGIPTWTYTPDGEGRVNTVAGPTGTNLVSATSYNGFSEPTGMTFGSTDADAFSYDATTGRMTQYKATINGSAVSGTLTWNANWTLKTLATTDPYNTGNNGKTCNYTYDDMARLSQADCGSGNWGQSFSYLDAPTGSTGAFGNISKSVLSGRTGQSFTAAYSDTTNQLTTSGQRCEYHGWVQRTAERNPMPQVILQGDAMGRINRVGAASIRKRLFGLTLAVCALVSCDGPKAAWFAESRSPDGKMVATARTIQTSGIGTGDPGTFVYLNWTAGSQSTVIILALTDGPDGGGNTRVGMNWLTPKHLELTYKGPRTLDFEAAKCHGVDISVRDLSNATSQIPAR